ncbi:MAG TPA: type 1 glutamine amidotransferase [Methylomirabilota bacterium]|nr:type 1 glutamine amidotransferase [Methylomirabilota bacterium]
MDNKILSIKNINFETLGTLRELIRSDGYQIENIEAQNEAVPTNAKRYAAIIILGGPMAVYDNVLYLKREQQLIRNALKLEIPVLGICLGSQLIAQAIGGNVHKGGKKEIGWSNVMLNHSGYNDLFKGINTKSIKVFQWHGDTYDLPPKAIIMASSKLYPQAFRFGSVFGIQFHMEVNAEMIRRWAEEYSQELKRERIKLTDLLNHKDDEIKELFERCKVVYSNFSKIIKNKSMSY